MLDLTTIVSNAIAEQADASIKTHHTSVSPVSLLAEIGIQGAPTLEIRGSAPGNLPALHAEDTPDTDHLGRFHVAEELGRGGMGRVDAAFDPELRRTVAIKRLVDPSKVDPHKLARFLAEAQITAQLDHPNIVPVHELGVAPDGQIFMVMKKVRGRSLRALVEGLADGTEPAEMWPTFRLLMSFGLVCGAVAYAHDHGVLHRDLKPENIMIGDHGEVMVMDWGVARVMHDVAEKLRPDTSDELGGSLTMDGTTIGTPGYMSPEQARGELSQMDGRSDQWSLGAILYELLTLKRAYEGKTPLTILYKSVEGPPQNPRERAPELGIDEEVAQICLKAMSPKREDRFDHVLQFAFSIAGFLDGRRGEGDEECAD
jgi:eukaryotic-like serine/threonine-protein kinase